MTKVKGNMVGCSIITVVFGGGTTMISGNILHVAKEEVTEAECREIAETVRGDNSHLSTMLISIAAVPPVGAHMESVSVAWLAERQAEQQRLAKKARLLEAQLEGKLPQYTVEEVYTESFHIDNIVGHAATLVDLMLIGQSVVSDPGTLNAVLDGALFHARVPALISADAAMRLEQSTVQVAWADTPEAATAVKASVPILKKAKSVQIVSVDLADDDRTSVSALHNYLSYHGVNSSAETIESRGLTIAESLTAYADRIGSDLIVMGAYGHSRLRETVFGGVTRSMIDQPKRAIFLAR
ncbi:universal stress protein (plasmid) [Agrobacterium vitis]|uniref:universal stress protein n=1 Tax=Agrobacterium vitis TaxID=373 RepID=UPI003D2E64F8